MREMTAEKQQLMDFDLLISSEKTHYESDLTIYYVLSGRMQVEMGGNGSGSGGAGFSDSESVPAPCCGAERACSGNEIPGKSRECF